MTAADNEELDAQRLRQHYPTLARVSDLSQETVGYQEKELLREAVDCYWCCRGLLDQRTALRTRVAELEHKQEKWHEVIDANERALTHHVGLVQWLTKRAELAESQLQQVKADAERTERELQQYRLHVTEHRYVDATPNEDLPTRILRSYLDESVCVSEPPALAEIMNDASAKRNVILNRALQVLSFAARMNDGTA